MFSMCNSALNALRMLGYRDCATPLNDGMVKSGDVHYQSPTEFVKFSEKEI